MNSVLCEKLDIDKTCTSPYRPQSDDLVEDECDFVTNVQTRIGIIGMIIFLMSLPYVDLLFKKIQVALQIIF